MSTKLNHPTPNHLPPPITPALQNSLYTALTSSQSIPRIENALHHELSASGYISRLRTHMLRLLRSGECTTYPELMARVLQETQAQLAEEAGEVEKRRSDGLTNGTSKKDANGVDSKSTNGVVTNGVVTNGVNGSGTIHGAVDDDGPIKIPEKAIKEGARIVRKELEKVVEIEFEDAD